MKLQTHSTLCPGICTPRTPLSAYLAGAVGAAALIGAPQAEAAVTAVTFGFGSEFTPSDGTGYWSVGPGYGTLYGLANSSQMLLGYRLDSGLGAVYQNSSWDSVNGSGTISFFASGTVIGNGGNGKLGYAWLQNTNPLLDLTADQLNQNIGFITTTNNYGWANVSWDEASKALTVNSAYVESVANATITVGDVGAVPEPSRALLALAGLGGVALRRRRRLAA